jgi:hypothetical protein
VGRSRVRRRVIVATVVIGALVGGAVLARQLWLNDSARVVDADQAVERFRSQSTIDPILVSTTLAAPDSTAVPAPSLPEPGVYRYLTDGNERIDVLGGATHPYPAETTITVAPDGCGVALRWDLLVERREEWRLCAASDGIVLQTSGSFYHEFFAHGSEELMVCNQSILLVPVDGEPRPAVPQRCTLNDREWLPVWEVLERDTRPVEGVDVAVTHVRMTVDDNDDYWEHVVADYWLDDHGLPVAMSAVKQSKSSSGLVGDVVYDEQYSATLASRVPLR